MKLVRIVLIAVLCVPAALAAAPDSNTANPVTETVRSLLQRQAKNLTAAAEEMPADKYNFKPTAQQMTFGKLVSHIVESNNFLCAKLGNEAAPKEAVKDTDPKDKLVEALKNSFSYCETAMSKVQDSQLNEPVTMWGGRQAPKAAAAIGLTNDWADHYGAAAMYLRLNGLLPPTAQRRPAEAAKE